ncbi:MAG: DNA-processing protein DprA [Patescibacteria group bacterium]|jgi:DNA processing protein|nr:DNA-processing protein DprA [Patescibacteria group bacterium]
MKNSEEKILLGFSLLSNVGTVTFWKLTSQFSNIKEAWNFSEEHLIKAGIKKNAQKVIAQRNKINLDEEYSKLEAEGISILSPFLNKKNFPKQLQEISGAPFILYIRGNQELLCKKQLAIVGTRRPTAYGKQVVGKLASQVAQSGFIITSGMAMGIDSLAHQTAIENNQPTIAVLGSGLSHKILNQSFAHKLSQEILASGGAIISEYSPTFEANKHTFPARNRIISGLSLGTLVIEAGEKSGSLITASYALEQNREVFAVPGSLFSSQSLGTNWLIKQGAIPTTNISDINSAFGFSSEKITEKSEIEFENDQEKLIYKTLNHEPMPIDKIAKISKIDQKILSGKLSLMELKGLIKNIGGGFIRN